MFYQWLQPVIHKLGGVFCGAVYARHNWSNFHGVFVDLFKVSFLRLFVKWSAGNLISESHSDIYKLKCKISVSLEVAEETYQKIFDQKS